VTERPSVSDHDPELPGLIDWGDSLLDATMRAEQERAARRRRNWRRRAIPALAAIGVLAVPGAVVATRSIWDDPVAPVTPTEDPSTPSIRLAEDRVGDVFWQVGGWNSRGRVCLRTVVRRGSGSPVAATGCGTPGAAGLTMMPVIQGSPAVIAGTTTDAVATVRVTPPAGDAVRVRTVTIPATNLRRSHLQGATRIYVALFPEGFGSATAPPVVEGFDADGAPVGQLGEAQR
jgi:hypothetical protein